MRKLRRREAALVFVLAVAGIAATFTLLRKPEVAPALRARARNDAPPAPVPRIDLARLDQAPADDEAGRRDLFVFSGGRVAEAPEPEPPRVVVPPPAAGATDADADARPATPSVPPLNLRYIGSVESARGVKVAVLVTDKREVLTGQAGEVVANRYRIARIGLESVDLEDVGTGQSRRIPLRGGS